MVFESRHPRGSGSGIWWSGPGTLHSIWSSLRRRRREEGGEGRAAPLLKSKDPDLPVEKTRRTMPHHTTTPEPVPTLQTCPTLYQVGTKCKQRLPALLCPDTQSYWRHKAFGQCYVSTLYPNKPFQVSHDQPLTQTQDWNCTLNSDQHACFRRLHTEAAGKMLSRTACTQSQGFFQYSVPTLYY